MLKTYINANGQTVAQDGAGTWRIYHPTTGSFGVFASAPSAEALKQPVEVQHPATVGSQQRRQEPNDVSPGTFKSDPLAHEKLDDLHRRMAGLERKPIDDTGRRRVWPIWLGAAAIALIVIVGLDYVRSRSSPQQDTAAIDALKAEIATLKKKPPAASVATPAVNPMRAQQQALCDEQAGKRRALGIPSVVVWDNQFTCRATGGMVQTGRI